MRADVFLTEGGYVQSRQRAKTLIEGGCVVIDGVTLTKPSTAVSEGEHRVEITDSIRYVGRGGLKLEAALDAFSINPCGMSALDIGASTGGFTDCLLSRGAENVCAIDAGEGQLSPKLLSDPRVRSIERFNARELTPDIVGDRVDLIVMDVSFISATYIMPRFPALLREGGHAVVLIKPQFEVGRQSIGKGGIVKDIRAHREAIERVLDAGEGLGLSSVGLIVSPVTGGDGNREFLVDFIYCSETVRRLTNDRIRAVTGARSPERKERTEC
ncbi:MAG: TlyA family RNA methyltransferase [Ruminococcaceae bacterium]|nr:TlyA family RNA methyltransferase [Oscillospiraceae bacterium]